MTRKIIGTVLALLVCCKAYGQAAPAPSFEVASVKPYEPVGQDPNKGHASGGPLGTKSPGQFNATGVSLKSLLFGYAYNLYSYQYAAPSWMDKELYDVAAKVPPGTTRGQFQSMLRNLLIERFKIAFHYEPREMTVYDLVAAKSGPKVRPSTSDEKSSPPRVEWGADGFPAIPTGVAPYTMDTFVKGQRVLVTNKFSMPQLADRLSGYLQQPIVDKTGLNGDYAFMLHYAQFAPQASSGAATSDAPASTAPDADIAPDAFAALRDQLGLSLEQHKGLIDVLVIDHAEKVPVER